jgi:hypothetical protein
VKIKASGQQSLFFQGRTPLGLSTGLAVLKAGFVLVADCPTNNLPPVPGALPGSLLLIDRNGNLVTTIVSPFIEGPWDFTVLDEGNQVVVFVSSVINGTVSRLVLLLGGGNVVVRSAEIIADGYTHAPTRPPSRSARLVWPTIPSGISFTSPQPEITPSLPSRMQRQSSTPTAAAG